jgi:dihydrolipoamide dehydrogenase
MAYDLVIIGAGPGGYVSAIRAGQSGLKTALVEASGVGGMCLNWGCVPTKSLLESAKRFQMVKESATFGVDGIEIDKLAFNWQTANKRSERIVKRLTKGIGYLLKKNGVEIVEGLATINNRNSVSVSNRLLDTKHIIIATGSRPLALNLPVPEQLVTGIKELLDLKTLPEQPVVVGNGPHAIELAQFFNLVGKEVKLAVPDPVLAPRLDFRISAHISKMFKKAKIEMFDLHEITGYEEGFLLVADRRIPCDRIVNASEREAVVPQSGEPFSLDEGFIKVDEFLRTSAEGIYAVGDVNGRCNLAHTASAQGLHAVNVINGIQQPFDFNTYPLNIYTYPEIAQVGMTEDEIKQRDIPYKVNEFPLSANSKALIEGHIDGFIRMLSDKKYSEVLGIQIVAEHATDMIAEAALLMSMEGTTYDVAQTIHAHPTVSEIFMEAGFDAFEQPVHI